MPPANPSPAERPARRSAKQKPDQQAAAVRDGSADLLTEISFLRGLIEGLQREVADLRAERPEGVTRTDPALASQNPEGLCSVDEPLIPELASAGDGFQGAKTVDSQGTPLYEEAGDFAPYEPKEFAQDFAVAFEDPEPIDWGKWAENDGNDDSAEEEDSWSTRGSEDPALDELVRRHPGLIEDVIAFNKLNPPDYEDGPSFDLAVKRANHGSLLNGDGRSDSLKLDASPPASVHDLMAELVAEASQSPAVSGAAGFESPLPDDLSGFAHDEATGYAPVHDSTFRQDDFSYAPASADQHPPKRLEADLIERVPAVAAIRACLLPLDLSEGVLRAGAPRPFDLEAIEEFESQTGLKVSLMPMPLEEVIQGLREGYSTRDEEEFRLRLLSGAAPSVPKTLMERASEFLPFLKRAK